MVRNHHAFFLLVMAISVTLRGTSTANTGAVGSGFTSTSALIPANFTAGTAVMSIAYSNEGGGGADGLSSLTDSLGNTWTLLQSVVNTTQGAGAGGGVVLRIYSTNQSAGLLTTSTTINITWSKSSEIIAASFYQVNVAAGKTLSFISSANTGFNPATTWTITTASMNIGDLVIGAIGWEGNTTTSFVADTDTTGGSWTSVQKILAQGSLSGGGFLDSEQVATQTKIVTAAGTQTFNGSFGGSGTNIAVAYVTFREVSSGSYSLIADVRAFNDTFNAANLLKGSKVFADVRSFNDTFFAANLFKSRSLIASGRTFIDTFFDANLTKFKRIVAEMMPEVITFPETFLKYPKTMIASGTSLALTSAETNLLYDIFAPTYYDIQAENYVSLISSTETKFIAPAPPPIQPPIGEGNPSLQYSFIANGRDITISRKTAQGVMIKVGLLTADIGSPTGTWSGTFGTRYTLINDIGDTAGTSVLTHGTTAGSHDFRHSLLSGIPTGSTINRLVIRHTTRRNGGATSVIRSNVGIRNATNQVVKYNAATIRTPVNGTYTTYDETWNINPATNANWTIAQITGDTTGGTLGVLAAQIGFTSTDANPSISISRTYLLTTYTLYEVRQFVMQSSGISLIADPTIVFLKYNRTFVASGGNLTLTRIDAIVKKSYVIPIVQKSFSTTLVAANLLKTKKIIADVRNVLVAYPNTNVAKATRMTSTGISMSMSFVDVNFKKGINMVATGRNLNISSSQVSLIKNLTLTASGRSMTISANIIGNIVSRKVVASVGSYNLTTTGSSLIHTSKVVATAGSISINGVVVNVRKAYVISAAKATLISSASTTSLLYARRIPISVSSVLIQGKVVNLTRISLYNLSADSRSFTTTLNPSVLKAAFRLSAVSKSIAISGQFAYLKKGIIFSIGKATFLMIPKDIVFKLKAGIIFKMWTGTEWKFARLKVWNGSSWVGELKRWTGTIWKNK